MTGEKRQNQVKLKGQVKAKIQVKPKRRARRNSRRSRRQQRLDAFMTWGMLLVLLLISLRGIYWVATQSWWGYQSQSWPHTKGLIVSAEIRESYGRGRQYSPEVIYQYRVGSAWYENDALGFPSRRTFSRSRVSGQLSAYPEGMETRVFYNPANPQVSCLQPGYSLGFTLFFLPLSVAMAGLSLWGIAHIARPKENGTQSR